MEYLKITCHRCRNSFVLYGHDMKNRELPPMCPACLVPMDKKQWGMLIDAYFTFSEVNTEFKKLHRDRGEPLFQAELRTEKHFVKPEDICLN